jgi:hypothetical protein
MRERFPTKAANDNDGRVAPRRALRAIVAPVVIAAVTIAAAWQLRKDVA